MAGASSLVLGEGDAPLSGPSPGEHSSQRLGRMGEEVAARELERAGYLLLARRARCRAGEIDLIALDGDIVVFVEVKARRGAGFGTPAEAVGPRKRRRMARVALAWLAGRGWLERRCRFDVVEVFAEGDETRTVRHHRDAFRL